MKNAKFLLLSSALLFAGLARAQLNIPVSAISTALPGISGIQLRLNTDTGNSNSYYNNAQPTPFLINNAAIPGTSNDVPDSLVWFCLDPLQRIYTSSNNPGGNAVLNYSTNFANFDKWDEDAPGAPNAPGLNGVRRQDLADLFKAYMPSTLSGNQSLIGALQLAVWEIVNEFDNAYMGDVNDQNYSLSGGRLRVRSDNTDLALDNALILSAQNMLDSLRTNSLIEGKGDKSYLDYLIDGTYTNPQTCEVVCVQDLLGWTPPGFTPPIPEPGTYALGALAVLLPLVLKRVRSRKSKTV